MGPKQEQPQTQRHQSQPKKHKKQTQHKHASSVSKRNKQTHVGKTVTRAQRAGARGASKDNTSVPRHKANKTRNKKKNKKPDQKDTNRRKRKANKKMNNTLTKKEQRDKSTNAFSELYASDSDD